MRTTLIISLFALLLLLGCKEKDNSSAQVNQVEIPQAESRNANYPDLQVYMSKPNTRRGSVGVSFPITEDKADWNRLSLGIDGRSYDTKIKFIERLPEGDRYRITIFEPVFENEELNNEKQVIYDEILILTDERNHLLEIEGVEFYTEA